MIMPTHLLAVLKSARPRQWIKNLSLYAALFFSGFFFYAPSDSIPYFWVVTWAVIAFSLVSSGVYLINDVVDINADRQHPFKKKRPIASGQISIKEALIWAIIFFSLALIISLSLGLFFKLLLISYIILQYLYARWLKHIPIADITIIATGFLIRIYAGAVVVNLHTNVWFLLTVISTSLFLAVGKRQSERTLLEGLEQNVGKTRASLKRYSDRLLDQYIGMFATASWLTYAIFTFQSSLNEVEGVNTNDLYYMFPGGLQSFFNSISEFYIILPRTLQSQKFLMLSLPLVIFGVMRYLQLIYEQNKGESPERVLLSDKPLLTTAILFVMTVFVVIYILPLL